ncbi:hypothetical protein BT96DRAFT_950453 [Gymnopus androsaceus JB14]|uniref:Uncharacterized protein n=1 Tax=Gymnopus androsaceus JB14 TaxID=1447944 RepID=A0A6A4GGJ9_9AGAR|nr:hypothetical protein BT96DRAFT_950453 [Gymnopus androsaceus JB14]
MVFTVVNNELAMNSAVGERDKILVEIMCKGKKSDEDLDSEGCVQVEIEETYPSPWSMEPRNAYLTSGPFCKDKLEELLLLGYLWRLQNRGKKRSVRRSRHKEKKNLQGFDSTLRCSTLFKTIHKTLGIGEVSSNFLGNGKFISMTGRDHSANKERKKSHIDDIEEHIERRECSL